MLFNRRDPASLVWPRRAALTELLDTLGQSALVSIWSEDETIGWVYQYFNSTEERKKMRDESPAPRNSRELAVRNQFFTPRYVVEFLTDNTLGRIWYEMQKGETRLADECRYLVRRPREIFLDDGQDPPDDVETEQRPNQGKLQKHAVYILHRPKKDPRDFKILDPACGSGHFLLYAFDLLISIYEEAWYDEASVKSELTENCLRDDYAELVQLHAALPGLVLRHNLHGIDIDPRAAQIAALALWMRGQRAYNDVSVSREDRPPIAKSNVVCAEPMPGETSLLEEFIEDQLSGSPELDLLAQLVRQVFDAMQLADETGSLLRIEHEIAGALSEAKEQWASQPQQVQQSLFVLNEERPPKKELAFDLSGITDAAFWEQAEQKIYSALSQYAVRAEGVHFQRRLFSDDVASGFAFIDLCNNSYDVVLMNPPFGVSTPKAASYSETHYPNSRDELAATFITRTLELLQKNGLIGVLATRKPLFLKSYRQWRANSLEQGKRIPLMADLGAGVLDAVVEVSAYIVSAKSTSGHSLAFQCFENGIVLPGVSDSLSQCCKSKYVFPTFDFDASKLKFLPNTPFAYWSDAWLLDAFAKLPRFEKDGRHAMIGASSKDNFRFIRLRVEVPLSSHARSRNETWAEKCWVPFAKGGEFSPYYRDAELCINWKNDGRELKAYISEYRGSRGWGYQWTAALNGHDSYFRPGITWSRRTAKWLSARPFPAGGIFAEQGPFACCDTDDLKQVCWMVGWFNSTPVSALLAVLTGKQGVLGGAAANTYEVGIVSSLPFIDPTIDRELVVDLVTQQWSKRLDIARYDELSSFFCKPCSQTVDELTSAVAETISTTRNIQLQLDEVFARSYKLSQSDLESLQEVSAIRTLNIEDPGEDLMSELTDPLDDIKHYLLGVALGRWNPDLSISPLSSDAMFDPLPRIPMGLSHSKPIRTALVQDEGHQDDGVRVLRDSVEELYAGIADDRSFSAISLSTWLATKAFREHISRYSRSRRKAPIYWQLSTPSASYSVWLYYHHFTKDTFFKVLNEYAKPKLDHERQKLDRLRSEAGVEPTRSRQKEIEGQEKLVAELASIVEEIERIAPLWNPNLNDGVIINFAPLWRLVPQNKSWQKECKKVWDKLIEGEYDWTHLSMHLWPERVVPKCSTDASIAITHGLEEIFWEQNDRDRFQSKEEPRGGWEPVIKELVEERTSPAVKAALESLLSAPALAGNTRSRRQRAIA